MILVLQETFRIDPEGEVYGYLLRELMKWPDSVVVEGLSQVIRERKTGYNILQAVVVACEKADIRRRERERAARNQEAFERQAVEDRMNRARSSPDSRPEWLRRADASMQEHYRERHKEEEDTDA